MVVVEDECFLAVDGAEYCVLDPTAAQLSPLPSSSAASSSPRTVAAAAVESASVTEEVVDVSGGTTSLRVMMGLCFLVAIVCALDRVAMSVAIVPMGQAYAYSDTTKGLVGDGWVGGGVETSQGRQGSVWQALVALIIRFIR